MNRTFLETSIGYKPVKQLNLDGTLIKVWSSRKEAAESLGLRSRLISDACCLSKGSDVYANYRWVNVENKSIPEEVWAPAIDPKFAGFFVSSMGRIRTKRGKITYGSESNGYKMTSIRIGGIKTTRKVHCLIYEAFMGKSNLLVNHKDGNKSNNRLDNLEYVNAKHAHETGLHPGFTKEVVQYNLNGDELARYKSLKDAKSILGKGDIGSVLSRENKNCWRIHLEL